MNGGTKTGDARKLQALLGPYRSGACPVRLSYRNGAAEAEMPLPDGWRVVSTTRCWRCSANGCRRRTSR